MMTLGNSIQSPSKADASRATGWLFANDGSAAPSEVARGCPKNVYKERTPRLGDKLLQQFFAVIAGGVCAERVTPFHAPKLTGMERPTCWNSVPRARK